MSAYTLSADTDLDLGAIWEFIAQDDIDAADRWIGRLFSTLTRLDGHPASAISATDLTAYPVLFFRSARTSSAVVPLGDLWR